MWGSRVRSTKRRKKTPEININSQTVTENITKYIKGLHKHQEREISLIREEIESTERLLPTLTGRVNIHLLLDKKQHLVDLQDKLSRLILNEQENEFRERVGSITDPGGSSDKKKQQLTIYMNIFHNEQQNPVFIDSETCSKCRSYLIFHSDTSIYSCHKCGHSQYVLNSNVEIGDPVEVRTGQVYERTPLYRKYLLQFSENAPEIPRDVINKIYKQLTKVHIMSSMSVKPTPIAQILRHEREHKWASYAVRITKMINNEVVPVLTTADIDRLVYRFQRTTEVFEGIISKDRKKIMNFEFLTRKFLQLDGRNDLAHSFACHKTKTVLTQADTRIIECCHFLKDTDDLNWDIRRSC
jgi:hypothetical protein